jgi:predicted ribosome quality control (RQC) complex YloA/Tae2 family protein
MTFDSIVMAAVADELNKRLAGGRVDEVYQPVPLDAVLTIRAGGANHMLLVSAEAESPRIHFTSTKRPNPQTPPNFCMLMRKYLKGARFTGAEQMDFDRILHVNFSAYDGEQLTLVVEIMGKHSNAILINGAGRILGTVKPVGKSKSRVREILVGRQYVAPPSQNKANPLSITEDQLRRMMEGVSLTSESEMAPWLMKTFTGISPFAAKEMAARSGDAGRLPLEFTELFSKVRSGTFAPVLITNDSGQSLGFYAFPTVQHPRENQHERPSISTVADMYYSSALPRDAFDDAKQDFINRLRKQLKSVDESLQSITEKMTECENAERYKQLGELILAQTSSIPPTAESAELVDYYDPEGKTVAVRLDTQLTPAENAEAYFKKYHKAVTGAEALRDRLTKAENEARLLRKALDASESVTAKEQIDELLKILNEHGVHVRKPEVVTQKQKKGPEFEGHRIQKIDANGWEILVGLNSTSNDYLLTKVAKPTDIWIHVKASPSAHVVIRTHGKPDTVPRQILEQAAEQAAKHSDSKHSSLVPVDYTQKKYVRKPRGAAPGKALYVNEKTIYITPQV